MIYEMGRSIEALMREKDFPISVVYGPDGLQRGVGSTTGVIVVERDRDAGDALSAPRGTQRNARRLFTFELAVRATILGRSAIPGAHLGDHERECERYVRGFIAALHRWSSSERAAPLSFQFLGMLADDGLAQYPGCAYVLQFRVPTGLEDLTYTPEPAGTAGDPEPTGSPTGVQTSTEMRLPGAPLDPGCGPLP